LPWTAFSPLRSQSDESLGKAVRNDLVPNRRAGRGHASAGHRAVAVADRIAGADERAGSPLPLEYVSPLEVLVSPDGSRLYVLCQESQEVRVLDGANYAPVKVIAVGRTPRGMALSSNGDRLFVTNSWTILCRLSIRERWPWLQHGTLARSRPGLSKIAKATSFCCESHLKRRGCTRCQNRC